MHKAHLYPPVPGIAPSLCAPPLPTRAWYSTLTLGPAPEAKDNHQWLRLTHAEDITSKYTAAYLRTK